ncbi:hypothetical protein SAMN05421852_1268 [Thermoflavimicrobium dichotomicum]|uniref:Uncharacterized protein n=1 Tax=Thermoflavimicrobium dichotomicum TaxID=46223 RepID=A0A1I3UN29_9BACL|nr:hypothetical protein SAMN05421852_1268 [Thermoflavimicrobium dichotomicum]
MIKRYKDHLEEFSHEFSKEWIINSSDILSIFEEKYYTPLLEQLSNELGLELIEKDIKNLYYQTHKPLFL